MRPQLRLRAVRVRAAAVAVLASDDPEAHRRHLGDLLFAAVELARHLDVDAEAALRHATDTFRQQMEAATPRTDGGAHAANG